MTKKVGAGHAGNKDAPKGKGGFPARGGGPNQSTVGASKDKKLPPWLKKKEK